MQTGHHDCVSKYESIHYYSLSDYMFYLGVKYGNVWSSGTDRKMDTDTEDREVHGG